MAETETSAAASCWRLRVIDGPDRGKVFALQPGVWSLGRSKGCSIVLNAADKLLSRRHAELRIDENGVLLADLGSGNGTWLNDARIETSMLRSGDVFRLGSNMLALEGGPEFLANSTILIEPPGNKTAGRSRLRVLLLGACLLGLIGFIAVTVVRHKPGPGTADQKQAEAPATPTKAPAPNPEASVDAASNTAPAASATPGPEAEPEKPLPVPQDKAKAEEAFRQGLFFYKSGELRQAVEEWSKASAFDPDNEGVTKWLLRAESELDRELDKHFRQALLAVKYMRYDEARNEFRLVIEWARDPADERVRTARENLKELERK